MDGRSAPRGAPRGPRHDQRHRRRLRRDLQPHLRWRNAHRAVHRGRGHTARPGLEGAHEHRDDGQTSTRQAGHGQGAARVRHALSLQRPSRRRDVRPVRRRPVVGRDADAAPGARRTDRPRRHGHRGAHPTRRIPLDRDRRSTVQGQRPARLVLRRQPARSPSGPRQGRDRRRHARGPARDAAPQHHRRADSRTIPTTRGCSTSPTRSACTSSTRRTSRAMRTTPVCATTRRIAPHGSSGWREWSPGTATTPRS